MEYSGSMECSSKILNKVILVKTWVAYILNLENFFSDSAIAVANREVILFRCEGAKILPLNLRCKIALKEREITLT